MSRSRRRSTFRSRRRMDDSAALVATSRGSKASSEPTGTVVASVRTQQLLLVAALLFGLGFAATFLVALHTARGLHYDGALFRRVSGSRLVPVETAGERAL